MRERLVMVLLNFHNSPVSRNPRNFIRPAGREKVRAPGANRPPHAAPQSEPCSDVGANLSGV
jgi:hypothetical protein